MKRIVVISIFGVIVVAGVFAVLSAAFRPVTVSTAQVSRGPAMETVYATGRVEARDRRVLRADRPAVIEAVLNATDMDRPWREGDAIRKGEAILRLRDSELEAQQRAAKAELDRVIEQLEPESHFRDSWASRIAEAREVATDARARESRLKAQLDSGGLSRDAYDRAAMEAGTAEQRVSVLEQEYAQLLEDLAAARISARSRVETLEVRERDNTLTAPLDGVILTLPLEPGEFAPAGTELAMVGDIRDLVIEAEVNEDDIGRVRLDQPVEIRLAGFEDDNVQGRVYEILPDAVRPTRSYLVEVALDNASFVPDEGEKLKGRTVIGNDIRPMSGMTAELGIVVRRKGDALTFPRPALTSENNVFVVGDNNRVTMKQVRIGLVNFRRVEVVRGLEEGDVVVTSNLAELSDGALINSEE